MAGRRVGVSVGIAGQHDDGRPCDAAVRGTLDDEAALVGRIAGPLELDLALPFLALAVRLDGAAGMVVTVTLAWALWPLAETFTWKFVW